MNNTWFKPLPLVSLESIAFQTGDVLCRQIETLIEEYRFSKKNGAPAKQINETFSDLCAQVIGKRIKAKDVTLDVVHSDTIYNAYAVPPDMVRSSVLIKSYFGLLEQAAVGRKTVKRDAEAIGWVDLNKVELGGVFQKVPMRIGVYSAVLGNEFMTPAEATAIIMHEIGHVVTYYEMLSSTVSSALVLLDSVNRLTGTNSDEERVKLVNKLEMDYDIRFENPNELVTSTSPEVMTVNILTEINDKIRSEFGSTIYDIRSWESISDQFASRMGCTLALATGLEKILRMGESSSFTNAFVFYALEVVKTILSIVGMVGLVVAAGPAGIVFNIMVLSIMAAINPHNRLYDRPRERIIRLRNETVAKMKSRDFPIELRKTLEDDVKAIDAILANISDKESFVEKAWLIISPTTRKQKNLTKELQGLEALVNNDLFSRSNSLKILQGK